MFPRDFFPTVFFTVDYFPLGGAGAPPPPTTPPQRTGITLGIRIGL